MAKKPRKVVQMVVTVSVPHWASAAQVRRYAKLVLGDSRNWPLDGPDFQQGNMTVKSVRPA